MHWMKWAELCLDVNLNPLIILYMDMVTIFNTFTRQYHTGVLTPIRHQVRSCTVEDAVRPIGQVLVIMEGLDLCLTR